MKWFKKKEKENKSTLAKDFDFTPFRYVKPPTPKHIIPIQELTRFAENAFNSGDKEIEADTLRSLVNHIERYLNKQTEA